MFMVNHLVGFGVGWSTPTYFGTTGPTQSAAAAIAFPAGVQAGDHAIIAVTGNAAPSWTGLSGWSTVANGIVVDPGAFLWVYCKTLTAGDISSPPSYTGVTNGANTCSVWRGGVAIAGKTTAVPQQSGANLNVPAFTKSPLGRLAIGLAVDRDPGVNIVAPTGFTERSEGSSTFFRYHWADNLNYEDTTLDFTGLSGSFSQTGASFEITD